MSEKSDKRSQKPKRASPPHRAIAASKLTGTSSTSVRPGLHRTAAYTRHGHQAPHIHTGASGGAPKGRSRRQGKIETFQKGERQLTATMQHFRIVDCIITCHFSREEHVWRGVTSVEMITTKRSK